MGVIKITLGRVLDFAPHPTRECNVIASEFAILSSVLRLLSGG